MRIVDKAPILKNPTIYCTARKLEFPIDSEIMRYILQKSPLKYEVTKENFVTTQLNLLNIGPAQILTVPGEALPNVGYYVKRNMNTNMPFLLA